MVWNVSDDIANAQLDVIEALLGPSPFLKVFDTDWVTVAADPGILLISMTLPSDWSTTAAARQKTLLGSWFQNTPTAAGNAHSFGLYTAGGVPKARGKIGLTGDATAQMIVPTLAVQLGVAFQINSFTIARP